MAALLLNRSSARVAPRLAVVALAATLLPAAPVDPKAQPEPISASALRDTFVTLPPDTAAPQVPPHDLPPGYQLQVAAAPPLVTHPIAACLDDRGRLFVGDAVGVNWNKAALEANPPNRVLMLEDTDADGQFDRSTVFADAMTFPQGAQWLDGSLYVASPPSIWKLTDTDDDGVADERIEIVTGFDYTGNAADVHGPFLHPSGRLYWCHGRKGYHVRDASGKTLHEGKSSGIWSCQPDGSDVQWHSLLAGDNPVEIDFTPEGDLIGVQNLFYRSPRGDTLMHWLLGGVYERPDQMQVIADLPRTLKTLPVIHNFGHVAVSGSCFWRSYAADSLHFLVTHFNTQRLVRMELTPDGSTFAAREHEFLKLHNPDIHLTDVLEDPRDGSLLLLDTGGWFRIGCPSSLMAKPDIAGAIYRIQRTDPTTAATTTPWTPSTRWLPSWQLTTAEQIQKQLRESEDPRAALHACMAVIDPRIDPSPLRDDLLHLLAQPLDPALEHATIWALSQRFLLTSDEVEAAQNLDHLRKLLLVKVHHYEDSADRNRILSVAARHLECDDEALARVALDIVSAHPDADDWITPDLQKWLDDEKLFPNEIRGLRAYATAMLPQPQTQALVAAMLRHADPAVVDAALRAIGATQVSSPAAALVEAVSLQLNDQPSPAALSAAKALQSSALDQRLQAIASQSDLPLTLRLQALDAMHKATITPETFDLVNRILLGTEATASIAARSQAATMIAAQPLDLDRLRPLAPAFATLGPIELKTLLPIVRRLKDADTGRAIATNLAQNPLLGSLEESALRSNFSSLPPELFEDLLLPALTTAQSQEEDKKRQLPLLADQAATQGDPDLGREVFASGKGSCIACHKVGDLGRDLGPNLSTIGSIRREIDLLESILFPSRTLARDYEAHVIELSNGDQFTGVIRSHTAEGLLLMDVAGTEHTLPHDQITASTPLETSLMPAGLDTTLSPTDLLHLTAYLRSLR